MRSNNCGAGILFLITGCKITNRHIVIGKSRITDEWEIPGGKKDEEDLTLVHTAVRESIEEYGLDPDLEQELIDFININTIVSTLEYRNGSYSLYIVKLPFFDFEKANNAAKKRIDYFNKLDEFGKKQVETLVEISEYGKIDLWESGILNDKEIKKDISGFNIRDRDKIILNNVREKIKQASQYDNIPSFEKPLKFCIF